MVTRVGLSLLLAVGFTASADAQSPFRHSGFDSKHSTYSPLAGEHIDPASGALTLVATDLVLPGNAGFDLAITRVYSSSLFDHYDNNYDTTIDEDSWAGTGWRLHFGRVIDPASTVGGATSVEFGDGSRQALYSTTAYPEGWMTPGFARYDRSAHTLKLPNGLVYTFGHVVLGGPVPVRYVTEISDPFGNRYEFSYFGAGPVEAVEQIRQYLSPTQVRYVNFTYHAGINALATMAYEGRVWSYQHDDLGNGRSLLRQVNPPLGPPAKYEYSALPGELTKIESPVGGIVTLTYADALRNASTLTNRTRVVTQRQTSGRSVAPGAWTFAYGQGANQDTTTITCACDGSQYYTRTKYRFIGTGLAGNFAAWSSGALAELRIEASDGSPREVQTFTWLPSGMISPDPVAGQSGVWTDSAVYAPLLQSVVTTRGSQIWATTHEYQTTNFNDFGQPWRTTETGDFTRVTTRTFQGGFTPHIVGRVASTSTTVGSQTATATTTYDATTGFVTSVVGPGSPLQTFTARSDGNLASVKDALNQTTTFENYTWGKPQLIRSPTNTQTHLSINSDGTVASVSGAVQVNYLYDLLFRVRHTSRYGVTPVVTVYDNVEGTGAWVERGAEFTGAAVDGFGRPDFTYHSSGPRSLTTYDACGRPKVTSMPYTSGSPWLVGTPGPGTTTLYDELGRVTRITGPDGHAANFVHTGIDVAVVDAKGRTTLYDYESTGGPGGARLKAVTDADSKVTSYTYDVLGNLTKVSGPGPIPDRTWNYSLTTGLLSSDTQPESGTTGYLYDAAGNLTQKTDANATTTQFEYNADNRLTKINPPGTADDVTYTYDVHGRVQTLTGALVTTTFGYNAAGQLASRTDVTGGSTFVSSYGYDTWENLASITYPSGRVVTYEYDTHLRLATVRQNGNVFADQFGYDGAGRLASYRTGAVTHTLTYDAAGRAATLAAGSALTLTYGYDPVGNVETITDPLRPLQQFTYDAVNRLKTATGQWGQVVYSYNPSGDRLSETSALGTTNYTYNSQTRRLSTTTGARFENFFFDNVGQMTADGRGTYAYTPAGLLKQFTAPNGNVTNYLYDPAGLRLAKVHSVAGSTLSGYTIRSAGGSVLSEYKAQCGSAVWSRDIIYAGGRLLGSIKAITTEPTVSFTTASTSISESQTSVSATLQLSLPSGMTSSPCAVSAMWEAQSGTATKDADFTSIAAKADFAAGSASGATKTVTVTVKNDTLDELSESFSIALASVLGGQAGAVGTHIVTITDDDPTPTVSIAGPAPAYEGNSGTQPFVFTVTLSNASAQTVTVQYATVNGTAVAPSDFTATSGTLTFDPGQTSKTLSIAVAGDGAVEGNEQFSVTLSSPVHASLGTATGAATIWNDDAARNTWGDFYAPRDGAADGALFDPATALWHFKDSNTGGTMSFGPFGTSGDLLVPADYTGDGITDCAVYRPSTGDWFIAPSCTTTGTYTVGWGGDPSDVPVPADFDGDGKADVAVYRRSTGWWHILYSAGGNISVQHGWTWTNSIPVPGDYNGDGKADLAFYADFNQGWMILYTNTWTGTLLGWGTAGSVPVPADYDGDGRMDLANYDPATAAWHILPSTTGIGQVTAFGVSAGIVPVPADYDADGKIDIAFYHPPDRSLWILRSSSGTTQGIALWSLSPAGSVPILRKPQ